MLANFFALLRGSSHASTDDPFVRKVAVREPSPRNRGVERVLVIGWLAILAKSIFILWAWKTHSLPFNPLWLIAPTFAFALLTTGLYFLRVRR